LPDHITTDGIPNVVDRTGITVPIPKDSNIVWKLTKKLAHSALVVLKRIHAGRVLLFTTSLFLFIFAISLMKDGARAVSPFVREELSVHNAFNSLGFGWLFAYLVMSGSPVAAAALAFFDAGAIDQFGAFTMVTLSRICLCVTRP
jgi:hypothetical protein